MFTGRIYGYMEEVQKKKIRKILENVETKSRILDIGSGPGFLSEFLDVVSVDIDLENLKKAKGLKVLASGDFLPFKSGIFDLSFCIDSIHLIKNTDEIFRSAKKVVVSHFCNKYNYTEKMNFLKSLVPENFRIEKDFVIEGREWDTVVVAGLK